MEQRSGRRTDGVSTRRALEVAAAACAGLALSAIAAAIAAADVTPPSTAALVAVARAATVAVPIAVGLYAWHRRPTERFGRLLVAAGCAWFLTTLAESGNDLLYSVGRVSGWTVEIWLIWLMLAFPSGRLQTTLDRRLVQAAAALVVVLYLPTALLDESYPVPSPYTSCDSGCPDNAFFVLGSEPGFVDSLVVPLRELLTAVLYVAVAARIAQRVRNASSLMRRALGPVLTVAIARLVIFPIALGARRADSSVAVVDALMWAAALAVPALAVAFFIGLFQRRLYAADALQMLGLRVRANLSSDELRSALSDALEDPSLELVYAGNGTGARWLDADGRPVAPPSPDSGRYLSEIHSGDRLVAGLVHDAALEDQRDFVEAVSAYALIALENRRLTARVETSLREVRESRARLQASADSERRRIERDLHDGAQQRLVALRIQLELAEELVRTDPVAGGRKLHELGDEVGATLDEIRALAGGLYPSLLADRGLAQALRAASLSLPVAARVEPDGVGRYPEQVESAVYFCCLEAMQNVSKHAAGAHSVTITLGQYDDGLHFEVRDDGDGFDTETTPRGRGLTNMHDRLAAVGGAVQVRSQPGDGTVVSGDVPRAGLLAGPR